MTYFELYELPISFITDPSYIKKKFLELSRLYHPDRYVNKPIIEQTQADEMSAMNNRAYKTFSDPVVLIKYVLSLYHKIDEEETHSLDQEFLMEMLDLNDLIISDSEKASSEIHRMKSELKADVQSDLNAFNPAQINDPILDKIKEYYFKMKYLGRLEKNLHGIQDL